jgi:hypothetical protein
MRIRIKHPMRFFVNLVVDVIGVLILKYNGVSWWASIIFVLVFGFICFAIGYEDSESRMST